MRIRITAAERRGRVIPLTAAVRRTLGITDPWPAVHCSQDEIAVKVDGRYRIFDIPPGRVRPCGWSVDPEEYAKQKTWLRAQPWSRKCTDDQPCAYCGEGDVTVVIEQRDLNLWGKPDRVDACYEVVDLAGRVLGGHDNAWSARRQAGRLHAVIETAHGREGGPHVFDAPGDGITWPPTCSGCGEASDKHAEPGSYVYDEDADEWSCGPCRAAGGPRIGRGAQTDRA